MAGRSSRVPTALVSAAQVDRASPRTRDRRVGRGSWSQCSEPYRLGCRHSGQRPKRSEHASPLHFVSEPFRINALQEPARGDVIGSVGWRPPADRGIELIEAKLQGQPELQAQLYAAAARVYVDLGIDRKATRYASRQLDSLRAQKADNAKNTAAALMLLAEAALAADRDSDAEQYAREGN